MICFVYQMTNMAVRRLWKSTVRKPAISEDDLMLKCIVNLILICHQNYRTSFSWILWFMFVTGAVRIYLRELKTNETGDEKHVTLRKQWCIFKMWDRFISITLVNTAEQFFRSLYEIDILMTYYFLTSLCQISDKIGRRSAVLLKIFSGPNVQCCLGFVNYLMWSVCNRNGSIKKQPQLPKSIFTFQYDSGAIIGKKKKIWGASSWRKS